MMKKSSDQNGRLLRCACALLTLTLAWAFCAPALAYSGHEIVCHRLKGEFIADGELTEWSLTSAAVMDDEAQVVRDKGQWTGKDDISASVYMMWDEENLYLAAQVRDDTPFMYREGFPPDLADALVLFLNTDPSADPERSEYLPGDFRLTMVIDDYYFNTGIDRDMLSDNGGFETVGDEGDEQVLEGYECAVKETEGGYVFEAKLPLKNFSSDSIPVLVPVEQMTVGVEFSMFDLDFPCPGVATARIAWSGSALVDENPSVWGTMTFAE